MIFRCSSLPKLMTNPRKKSESLSETAKSLSDTAKSYIKQLAKENFYGYTSKVETKQMRKGTKYEMESIALVNSVWFGSNFVKNQLRENQGYLSGHPDIITDDSIIDIKTSWSLETFPALPEDADSYEWQVRGYMHLFNKPRAFVIFCMIDTDDELLSDWDNRDIHKVSHIDPTKRITVVQYERDEMKEELMLSRLRDASEFYSQYMQQLINK
jgi:hypothetical protein